MSVVYIKCKEEILLKVNKAMIFELNDFEIYFNFGKIFPDSLNSSAVCYTLLYNHNFLLTRKQVCSYMFCFHKVMQ